MCIRPRWKLRFSNNEEVYRKLYQTIRDVLTHKEFIPAVPVEEKKEEKRPAITGSLPEPFETKRLHIPPQTQVLPQGQNVTPEPVRTPENLDVFRQAFWCGRRAAIMRIPHLRVLLRPKTAAGYRRCHGKRNAYRRRIPYSRMCSRSRFLRQRPCGELLIHRRI